jgi:hypothetical protein
MILRDEIRQPIKKVKVPDKNLSFVQCDKKVAFGKAKKQAFYFCI